MAPGQHEKGNPARQVWSSLDNVQKSNRDDEAPLPRRLAQRSPHRPPPGHELQGAATQRSSPRRPGDHPRGEEMEENPGCGQQGQGGAAREATHRDEDPREEGLAGRV